MKLTFLGAAGTVTGSAYLVATARARLLVDFGLFQGGATDEAGNAVPPVLRPAELDAILLTHAHLDHCGRLPLLTKTAFAGNILCTAATRDLAALILRDSAKVQAADVARTNRRRERAGLPPEAPLYTLEEVDALLGRFRVFDFDAPFAAAPGMTARFFEAGHMLGSASIELTITEQGQRRVVVFSGDLGPAGLAIVRDFTPPTHADVVVLESTYGNRDHRPLADTLAEFHDLVQRAARTRARMLVPAFAVGRSQQMLFHLEEIFSRGDVEPFPIYLDSPMAIAATQIYERHPDLFDRETRELERRSGAIAQYRHLRPTETPAESEALNRARGPCLIMAGAGMCNAGRILHHLRHSLWQSGTMVVIVGFQAVGTLGRRLVDGAESVTIFGEKIAVKAEIHTLNGFSAHAGQSELLGWFQPLADCRPRVFLTHGEAPGREALAAQLAQRHGLRAALPGLGEAIEI